MPYPPLLITYLLSRSELLIFIGKTLLISGIRTSDVQMLYKSDTATSGKLGLTERADTLETGDNQPMLSLVIGLVENV